MSRRALVLFFLAGMQGGGECFWQRSVTGVAGRPATSHGQRVQSITFGCDATSDWFRAVECEMRMPPRKTTHCIDSGAVCPGVRDSAWPRQAGRNPGGCGGSGGAGASRPAVAAATGHRRIEWEEPFLRLAGFVLWKEACSWRPLTVAGRIWLAGSVGPPGVPRCLGRSASSCGAIRDSCP